MVSEIEVSILRVGCHSKTIFRHHVLFNSHFIDITQLILLSSGRHRTVCVCVEIRSSFCILRNMAFEIVVAAFLCSTFQYIITGCYWKWHRIDVTAVGLLRFLFKSSQQCPNTHTHFLSLFPFFAFVPIRSNCVFIHTSFVRLLWLWLRKDVNAPRNEMMLHRALRYLFTLSLTKIITIIQPSRSNEIVKTSDEWDLVHNYIGKCSRKQLSARILFSLLISFIRWMMIKFNATGGLERVNTQRCTMIMMAKKRISYNKDIVTLESEICARCFLPWFRIKRDFNDI